VVVVAVVAVVIVVVCMVVGVVVSLWHGFLSSWVGSGLVGLIGSGRSSSL